MCNVQIDTSPYLNAAFGTNLQPNPSSETGAGPNLRAGCVSKLGTGNVSFSGLETGTNLETLSGSYLQRGTGPNMQEGSVSTVQRDTGSTRQADLFILIQVLYPCLFSGYISIVRSCPIAKMQLYFITILPIQLYYCPLHLCQYT